MIDPVTPSTMLRIILGGGEQQQQQQKKPRNGKTPHPLILASKRLEYKFIIIIRHTHERECIEILLISLSVTLSIQ